MSPAKIAEGAYRSAIPHLRGSENTQARGAGAAGVSCVAPVNPTPNVSFVYDPYFPRRPSMIDGTGTTTYAYVPVGSLGALKLQQEQGPVANS